MDEPSPPMVAGYHLGALLGRGSSARVYAGRRLADGRPVAVKVYPGGDTGEAMRELGTLRGVGGEHVVRLLDVVAVTDPAGLALVMERLDGGSLGQVVAARGQLTAGEVVTVLSPLAAALGGLHRAGVVHGDVAPGNVLFDETGRPALCDLGLSRVVGEEVHEVWGTPGFVAPEVLLGASPTPASDVYGLGAVGWFAATGAPPGPAWLRAEGEPTPDADLAAVLARCLASDPDARPDGVEAALALYEAAVAEPLRLPGSSADVDTLTRRIRAAAQAADPVPDQTSRRFRRWTRRLRGLAGGAAQQGWRRPVVAIAPGVAPRVGSPARPRQARPRHARSRGWMWGRRAVSGGAVAVLCAGFVAAGALVAVAAGWAPVQQVARTAGWTGVLPVAPTPTPATVPQTGAGGAAGRRTGVTARVTKVSDPLRRRDGPLAQPAAVAQALCDARARLWSGSTPFGRAELAALDAPGSAAMQSDEHTLRAAATGGWRYSGVGFTVRSAAAEGAVTSSVTLRVVLDAAAYTVSGPQGSTTMAAARGTAVRLDLAWTSSGWRVAAVRPG